MSNEFVWTDKLVIEYAINWARDRKIPSLAVEQFKQSHTPKIEKPPIGIIPMWLHNEQRREELGKAIERYDRANLSVPKEWVAEKQSLDAYCQGRLKEAMEEMRKQPLQFSTPKEQPLQRTKDDFNNALFSSIGKPPQRIEVKFVRAGGLVGSYFFNEFCTSEEVSDKQCEKLQQVIEQFLNQPEVTKEDLDRWLKEFHSQPIQHYPLYTQQQVDELCERTFNAGSAVKDIFTNPKKMYESFQDYKTSNQQNQ